MPIIAAFTFGGATLTVLEFTLMFLWIWIAVGVIFDVLSDDEFARAKAKVLG
jgi:hypothetical protein